MFRPNRIGTPNILAAPDLSSTANWAPYESSINQPFTGNVINAAPVGEFAQSFLRWSGSEAITAFSRIAIGQQFTVTAPQEGDTVGVELGGSLQVDLPIADSTFPVLFKVNDAGASVLAQVLATGPCSVLAPATAATAAVRCSQYRTQAIVKDSTAALVAGTYFHGIAIQDAGSGFTISAFQAEFYVRQLNDQQAIGYRDTLR